MKTNLTKSITIHSAYGVEVEYNKNGEIFTVDPTITSHVNSEQKISVPIAIDLIQKGHAKLLLHSLDKLTQEIDGKVGIVELCRMQGFSIGNLKNWKIEYQVSQFNEVAIMQNDEWIFRYMKNENSFWVNGIASHNKKHQKTYNQLELFNYLLEKGYNVFGLSSEYVKEKAISKNNGSRDIGLVDMMDIDTY